MKRCPNFTAAVCTNKKIKFNKHCPLQANASTCGVFLCIPSAYDAGKLFDIVTKSGNTKLCVAVLAPVSSENNSRVIEFRCTSTKKK